MRPEHSVNLEVVAHFLNHPLSPEQRELLHRLIDQSEFLEIAGHTVVIAQADASGFREELSALASRLRDFHETDAVFLVVNLGDIIQVVARSTTDEIHVGEMATARRRWTYTRCGRADSDSEWKPRVHDQIVQLVAESGSSAQTVRQIMSVGRPQTVRPHCNPEAAEFMRRYGHEGFPVVQYWQTVAKNCSAS